MRRAVGQSHSGMSEKSGRVVVVVVQRLQAEQLRLEPIVALDGALVLLGRGHQGIDDDARSRWRGCARFIGPANLRRSQSRRWSRTRLLNRNVSSRASEQPKGDAVGRRPVCRAVGVVEPGEDPL